MESYNRPSLWVPTVQQYESSAWFCRVGIPPAPQHTIPQSLLIIKTILRHFTTEFFDIFRLQRVPPSDANDFTHTYRNHAVIFGFRVQN
jgi:hypothetical protein